MTDFEYGLFITKLGTTQRQPVLKGDHPDDIRRLTQKACWILEDMRKKQGHFWRVHGRWSTGLEVWEFAVGGHRQYASPDWLLASAVWGAQSLTLEPFVERALFGDEEVA